MKKVVFISPMYNASSHLEDLVNSLKEQKNKNWKHIIVDDMSTDKSFDLACELTRNHDNFEIRKNQEKKYALKNVVDIAREYQDRDDVIIANLDADDALCNENTVDVLLKEYKANSLDAAWTAHSWDINGMNISRPIPDNINPYQHPWCSSHLKTWKASLMSEIPDSNFKNLDGEWFRRGYDQALYLPILFKSKSRKFVNEICYLYRINSKSVDIRIWSEKDQMDTVRLVRSRGFVH